MAAPKFVKRPTGTDPTGSTELATKAYADSRLALAAAGILVAPVFGVADVAISTETLIDRITFTHTQNRRERINFSSTFNLNASGVATMRVRYVSGAGPVTTAGTLMWAMLATGGTTNNFVDIARLVDNTFRALATGTYDLGIFAICQSGASSGSMLGAGSGLGRELSIADEGTI